MQQEVKTYDVNIAGVPLRLKATHDRETVDQILEMVEQKFDDKISKTTKQNTAILACLRLAEELYLLKNNVKKELDHIESLALDHVAQMQSSSQA